MRVSRITGAVAIASLVLATGDVRAQDSGFGQYVPPAVTVKKRTYTLEECLALTDRNHPNVWAARARLGVVHAQLDEARWAPYWQWSLSVNSGVIPELGGTPFFSQSTPATLAAGVGSGSWKPFMQFNVGGAIPLYTFGKISTIQDAAAANVRVNEWDVEKVRQQVRWDVRRAYFGLMLARDGRYLIDEILSHLKKGIDGIKDKLAKSDATVAEWDKLRLEIFLEETRARLGDVTKGEISALAALRFLTGVQEGFDIPDEPLKRPDVPLVSVVQYLEAARLFRPETNMARAGLIARQRLIEHNRAKLYPDIGIGLFASYSTAPNAVIQNTAWIWDALNRFGYGATLSARWNLDLMPQQARVRIAEAQYEETRSLERLSLGGVAVEVEQAYGNVMEAKMREEALDRAEHKAKQWLVTIQDAIDVGAQDERALTEPLRTYAFQRGSHLVALQDVNVQMSWLALASGWDSAAPTAK